MKITNKTKSDKVYLHEVKTGEVFFFEDTAVWGKEPFIRVFELSEVQCSECSHDGYYVMSLETFDVWEPSGNEIIRVVEAELILTVKEN